MAKKMRVWWIPQVPMTSFNVDVDSLQEGVKLMTVLADYDHFQFSHNIKPDYSNVGGIQEWSEEEGEWFDWVDEETGEDDPQEYLRGLNGEAG